MLKQFTFKKQPITLVGRQLTLNNIASNFKVTSKDLNEVNLLETKGNIKIIHSFPSLDTQVCDLQIKEFNKRVNEISNDIKIIGISKDLPFAQNRFCKEFDINNFEIFSDYKTSSYGINYGLLIKELNLLARSTIIIDKHNIIRYIQIPTEITKTLDYEDIFKNLNKIIKNPNIKNDLNFLSSTCTSCEGKNPPLSLDKIKENIELLNKWDLVENKKITKKFKFKDFIEAKYFLDIIAMIAQEQGHHPVLTLNYNILKISLFTHVVNGLTNNDFVLAKIIDKLNYG